MRNGGETEGTATRTNARTKIALTSLPHSGLMPACLARTMVCAREVRCNRRSCLSPGSTGS